jgi:hypothetical protein
MQIKNGVLRWIITPHKGKKYFLSPLESVPFENNFPKGDYPERIILNRKGEICSQTFIDDKEVVTINNQVVSHPRAEEIGAWQFDGDVIVIAQKVDGKWGVYRENNLISPSCQMVWGWSYNEGNFYIPIEKEKGDNLILLKNGEILYGGKGDLITWHHEMDKSYVLAKEDDFIFFCDGKEIARLSVDKTIVYWKINANKLFVEYTDFPSQITPPTCHPERSWVMTDEWWFNDKTMEKISSTKSIEFKL